MLKKWLVLSTTTFLLISGCSKSEEVKKEEIVEDGKKIEEVNELPKHYPLTGIDSESDIEGRAVAVMINNHPIARPQSGLNKADIVYELLAEGGVTRFLAIFQSEKPEVVGPVRSARDYYIELAKGFNSLYIAHGYSPEAKTMLENGYVDNLNGQNYDGTLFERASFRKAPHNSYITYENILRGAEERNFQMDQPPSSFTFLTEEEIAGLSGKDGYNVHISYLSNDLFNVQYAYDDTLEKYKRFSNGEQTIDYETNEPVLLDNLFIIETEHKTIDKKGRRFIDLTSGGKGYILQKGKRTEVEWINKNGRIVPILNGKEHGFIPGKTWVNVIPTDPGLSQSVSFEAN